MKPTVTPENKMPHNGTSRTRSRESTKWPKALSPNAVVLHLADMAGVPVDLVEARLESFFIRYANETAKVDRERRQKPALLVGCEVLRLRVFIVEWGNRVYGAEAAARYYYGTSAADLDPVQAAGLAATIPRPRYYERERDAPRLERRTWIILERMWEARVP